METVWENSAIRHMACLGLRGLNSVYILPKVPTLTFECNSRTFQGLSRIFLADSRSFAANTLLPKMSISLI